MKAYYLVIPLDSRTSSSLSAAMQNPEHVVTKRISVLAQLLNMKTLRSLNDTDFEQLRQGELLHHRLGLFRTRLQRLDKALQDAAVIIDPLLVLTWPLWISSIKPKHVFLAHGGIASIAEDLEAVADHSSGNHTEITRALIDEVIFKFSMDCSYQLLEVDVDQAPQLLEPGYLSGIETKNDQKPHLALSDPEGGSTEGRWLAWELIKSVLDRLSPDTSIDFYHQYRMLEKKVLRGREAAGSKSAKNRSQADKVKGTAAGEHQQARVPSVGRRIRYALQMLFSGRVKWKSRR